MSQLLFLDSFDHYNTQTLAFRKWTQVFGTSIVPGRTGDGLSLGFAIKTLGPEYPTLTLGRAFKQTVQPAGGPIIAFYNVWFNSDGLGVAGVGDGRFQHYAGGVGRAAPSTFVANLNEWYYLETQCSLSGGFPVQVDLITRVNNNVILTDTFALGNHASPKLASVGLQSGFSIADDVYVTDTEFLGDIAIYCLRPNAVGDASGWTPNIAGPNYLLTKDISPDDSATIVTSTFPGDLELENIDDILAVASIKGAQANWCLLKADAGVGVTSGVLKSFGSQLSPGVNYSPSNGSYLYNNVPMRKSPFTGLDFTPSEINNLQMGQFRVS